ncbi:MAG: LamG domain-containing protein [Verrucomicrobia bacterium]|nr:LamG domain-containing protein [Verrucomicrobiota bacterium]MDA1004940.1 LamG domain-containing protein [Verrucomicrobiota bacterium]
MKSAFFRSTLPGLTSCGVLAGTVAAFLGSPAVHADLVGYWNFNEGCGTTAFDATSNDNDGTLVAVSPGTVPTWIAGHTADPADYALGLSQGNVLVPDAASLHITNTFTLAAWIYDTGSNYGHVFTAGDGGAGGRAWLLQTSAYGGDSAYFWSGGGNTEFNHSLGFIPPLNSWHHIAVTYDGSQMKSYLDGVQIGVTATINSALDTWGTLRLGGYSVYGSGLEGRIDDAVIFNTVEDVTTIMDGTHPEMVSTITRYEIWANCKGLTGTAGSGTDPAFDADPEEDGVPNGLEWLLGGDPLASDPSILPVATADANGLTLTFTREEEAIDESTLLVEYGTTLTAWPKSVTVGATSSPADGNGVVVTIDTVPDPDTVSVFIPASNAPDGELFARLKATMP